MVHSQPRPRGHQKRSNDGEDFHADNAAFNDCRRGAGAIFSAQRTSRAQNWPSGIIKIIVPFPPGGTVDPIARLVQTGLQQRLGATIVIENKSGGSGSAGTAAAAKSAPDGNTWLFVFDTHAVNPFLQNLPSIPRRISTRWC